MKIQLFTVLLLSIFLLAACQQPAAVEEAEQPDYALFDKKVETVRAFLKAHSEENLEAQVAMLADTFQWSPPYYNGYEILDTEAYAAALKSYHDNFENITYKEGIVSGDELLSGWWSGSVFPQEEATSTPNALRCYGTWTATHTETQKDIGVKWFALCWVNDDGKIANISEYWDVNGLAAQIAAD
jgi:ketosteroid isomerase-like protein